MKKFLPILLIFAGIFTAKAQYKSEVKFNILNVLVLSSFEVGYEFFLDDNQSFGVELHINDRFSYVEEKDNKKFETNSFLINYNYYFSPEAKGSTYVFPFIKYRLGEHRDKRPGKTYTDMDAFIVGLGLGYKWAWNDKFAIAPYVSVGRNFSDKVNDRFMAIEINAGISVGFRF